MITVMLSSWVVSMITFLMFLFLLLLSMTGMFLMKLLPTNIFNLEVILNENTIMFSCMIFCIGFSVFMWARYYMQGSISLNFFFFILLFFVVSMILLILSNSLFMIFLGWEGLGITSFLLIVFYQNWSSFNGGLLTLLTNRVGDGILMLILSYWILVGHKLEVTKGFSTLAGLMLILLTMTKSAQIPFSSWLPAAMAAPTPVSALVHSSTLVTAGIWLVIRFGQLIWFNTWLIFGVGFLTLLTASTAAMMEYDGKKIVALSTLSQLGLMYFAMSMGGSLICLFHLFMHAVAKANLFLVVGNLIHSKFSQQDTRFMMGGDSNFLTLFLFISVLSLSGVAFTSGFYSKEMILSSTYFLLSSSLVFMLLLIIISLTLAYCFKLLKMTNLNINLVVSQMQSKSAFLPCLVLSSLSLACGLFFLLNLDLTKTASSSLLGILWMILIFFLLLVSMKSSKSMILMFSTQGLLLSILVKSFMTKQVLVKTLNTTLESMYLSPLKLESTILSMNRSLIFLALTLLILWMS